MAAKTSLAQRLHTRQAEVVAAVAVDVRFRGQFAYVEGELTDGQRLPLMRSRYGRSAHRWGTAIDVAGTDRYEDQIWLTARNEEAFDLVCDLHVGPVTP